MEPQKTVVILRLPVDGDEEPLNVGAFEVYTVHDPAVVAQIHMEWIEAHGRDKRGESS